MGFDRASAAGSSYIDVVDRVLDKGIVIDAWMRVSVGGIDLVTIRSHMIVASIETYQGYFPEGDGATTLAKRASILDPA